MGAQPDLNDETAGRGYGEARLPGEEQAAVAQRDFRCLSGRQ